MNPRWYRTRGQFSNFEFVDGRFGSHPALRRILSLARKLGYGGMLCEQIVERECSLLAAENDALRCRWPGFRRAEVIRLSFFTGSQKHAPGEYLGYAIVKHDLGRGLKCDPHIYESVLRPHRDAGQNNFCHVARDYRVRTTLGDFRVRGVLYAQQNDATFVCSHVAVRTLLACVLPQADITYAKIDRLAGVTPDRVMGSLGMQPGHEADGLWDTEIVRVLRHDEFGLRVESHQHEPKERKRRTLLPENEQFQRILYGYIESGMPALLGFEIENGPDSRTRHIIPIIGHTFNEDLWVPEAERRYFGRDAKYFPSESWLSSHVAHDDNFGPYVCLPRHYLQRDQFRFLVGLRPFDSALAARQAEALAFDRIEDVARSPFLGLDWFDRMVAFGRARLLVLRTLMVSRGDYILHLRRLRDRAGRRLEEKHVARFARELPDAVWVAEVSAPELYPASRRKFGELVVDPRPSISPECRILGMRLPGVVATAGDDFAKHRTELAGHTPLLALASGRISRASNKLPGPR